MAVIVPPGKPLSVPQESWRYCDTARLGSTADAETANQKTASPAMAYPTSHRLSKANSRQVFELLNHNLAWLLHRIFIACSGEEYQTWYGLARVRHAGRELMFRDELRSGTGRSPAKRLESRVSRFPMQNKRQGA